MIMTVKKKPCMLSFKCGQVVFYIGISLSYTPVKDELIFFVVYFAETHNAWNKKLN